MRAGFADAALVKRPGGISNSSFRNDSRMTSRRARPRVLNRQDPRSDR